MLAPSRSTQAGTGLGSYQEVVSECSHTRSEDEGHAAEAVALGLFLRMVEAAQARKSVCKALCKEKRGG